MHDLPLLLNLTIALIAAFIGGMAARRIGLPTIVGYLLVGILIGPFTPGFVGHVETIQQLAEIGVIFLLFGVGLQFTLNDLWKVRDVVLPGALLLASAMLLLAFLLGSAWGWSGISGLILGLAIAVSSSVVLLRGIMDHSLLNTPHGQVAVGWTVFEDIISVVILLILPTLGISFQWQPIVMALLKAAAFMAIMFFIGGRIIPWLLEKIAHTRSRELFILAMLVIALGTAMGASSIFGVSLALGAFVAGATISQTHLSHQVGADLLPFREAFAVLFFVSVGMLVNPIFLWQNMDRVLILTSLIVLGRFLLVLVLGLFFRRPARTFLVVGVGVSQIGEFSFIIGQTGMSLGLLSAEQYSLILAGALISITLNPLMYRLMPWIEKQIQRFPGLWKRLDMTGSYSLVDPHHVKDHVVIVGYGQIGRHLVDVLKSLDITPLVIEMDSELIAELNEKEVPVLYGDAANSEVITHAGLRTAKVLVITIPDEPAVAMIITAARDINPDLPIIVRADTEEGMPSLADLGANYVIMPELEGSLEITQRTLLQLGYPLREVAEFIESRRRDFTTSGSEADLEYDSLRDLLLAYKGIEITWVPLAEGSPVIRQTIAEANLRAKTGASIIAIIRDSQLIANPKSSVAFMPGDLVGMIGEEKQLAAATRLISP